MDLTTGPEPRDVGSPQFEPRCLYVGQVLVYSDRLLKNDALMIKFRAFNATRRRLCVYERINGFVTLKKKGDRNSTPIRLQSPQLLSFEAEYCFMHGNDFELSIEQPLTAEEKQKIHAIRDQYHVVLNFESLNILMGADGQAKPFRLPVWDSLTLSRDDQLRAANNNVTTN